LRTVKFNTSEAVINRGSGTSESLKNVHGYAVLMTTIESIFLL